MSVRTRQPRQAGCLITTATVGVGARLATGNPMIFLMSEFDG
jgi:hypothetical protein